MNRSRSSGFAACAVLLLVAILVLPVSGAVSVGAAPAATTAASTTTAAAVAASTPVKPFISATVSPADPIVGSPVTISGVASGANLTAGVQIWIFAGNYVNVSTTPVKADGTYSKTFDTTGLPPATYYVFVESPGADGMFGVTMHSSGQFAGQVVSTKTGSTVFTFTGTGSVHDAAAAAALSDAINTDNKAGGDDVYTKLTFNLVSPAVAPVTTTGVQTTASAAPAATKSPLPLELTGIALIIGILGAVLVTRK